MSGCVRLSQKRMPSAVNLPSATLLESTLLEMPVSVASKKLTSRLNVLDATLTKIRGEGVIMVNHRLVDERSSLRTCVTGFVPTSLRIYPERRAAQTWTPAYRA